MVRIRPPLPALCAATEDCQLKRQGLQPGYTAGGPGDVLASVSATGDAATPGEVRYTDSTIINAKVNNTRYGYVLSCSKVPWVGVYGATISYTTG